MYHFVYTFLSFVPSNLLEIVGVLFISLQVLFVNFLWIVYILHSIILFLPFEKQLNTRLICFFFI